MPGPGGIHGQPLADQDRERQRAELPSDPGPSVPFAAGDDERAAAGQGPPQPRQAAAPADVQDQVVMLAAVGEVRAGVVEIGLDLILDALERTAAGDTA